MKPFIVICLLFLGACSQVKDETAKAGANAATPVIAKYLDCANSDAIFEDVKSELDKVLGNEKKSLSLVCNATMGAVIPTVLNIGQGELPKDWECTLDRAEVKASELAQEVCSKLD